MLPMHVRSSSAAQAFAINLPKLLGSSGIKNISCIYV